MNSATRPILRAWEDPPLTDEGRADIQMAANKLKIYKPKIIYSSDFQRDTESAMLMAEILGNIPYETDFALRTADVGTLSGKPCDSDVSNANDRISSPSSRRPCGPATTSCRSRPMSCATR